MGHAHSTTSTKDRPLRRDAERNRLLILDSARTVFAQRGLDASLDEVAREAGLGVGTVYRRFANRDALIDALFDDVIDTIARVADEARSMARGWDGLRYYLASTLDLQCRDKGLRDVLLSYRRPDATDCLIQTVIMPAITDLVRRAQQEGDLRGDLSATDIGVLGVAVLGAAELTDATVPGVWSRYLSIILDGMRARPDGGNSALDRQPLDNGQLDECMLGWRYGTRSIPHPRDPRYRTPK